MELKRYRFNRKTGKIYLESRNGLIEIGSEMKVIILWAGDVVWGKPFSHLPAQNWVQLTFLDSQGNWCYTVLNSGNSNALYPWIQYRKEIERSHQLLEIVTTIGFDYVESDNNWFDYKFSGILGKPGLGDRMRQLIQNTKQFSLVDLDINLPI